MRALHTDRIPSKEEKKDLQIFGSFVLCVVYMVVQKYRCSDEDVQVGERGDLKGNILLMECKNFNNSPTYSLDQVFSHYHYHCINVQTVYIQLLYSKKSLALWCAPETTFAIGDCDPQQDQLSPLSVGDPIDYGLVGHLGYSCSNKAHAESQGSLYAFFFFNVVLSCDSFSFI